MAKPTGPLLSFGASGTIAKTAVYASWKGRPYVRRHVTPANPQSAGQTLTRNAFAWCSSVWKQMGPLGIAPWDRNASGQVKTGRNVMIGQNVNALRSEVDLALFIGSPGAKGGLAPLTLVLTPGVGQLSCAFTTPTPPTGWTLQVVVAMAIRDQNPQSATLYTTTEGSHATGPVVLTGLSANLYQVVGWTRWAKPDGTLAFGPSIIASGTPT